MSLFFEPKGNIYITSQDNGTFFAGWLPGTARHGYTRVQRTVTNIRPTHAGDTDSDSLTGEITLNKVKLIVETHDKGEEWTIRSTADGSIKRGRHYSR